MITHRLTLQIADQECPVTIHADHCVINRANEIEFYDADDNRIATVAEKIILNHTES